jgi:hypothetical protein
MTGPRAIEDAVKNGDAARVRDLLRGATEKERKECARELAQFLAEPGNGTMASHIAFITADVGLANGMTKTARALDALNIADERSGHLYDLIAGVLADRNPPWLVTLIDRLLSGPGWARDHGWQLARRLVRDGVITRPTADGYTLEMIRSVWRFSSPLDALLADHGLLDDEIWRVFEVQFAARFLALPPAGTWADAFCELATRGLVDRGRLLDACLDAFTRDFPADSVGWYVELHDRLAPTVAEAADRSAKYLALLASGSNAGITLGQRQCTELLAAGLLEPVALLSASAAALTFPQKSVASAQLMLVGRAALYPGLRDEALVTAAAALAHQREDIQAAALALIAKLGGLPEEAEARATIVAQAAGISPALAPDAAALGLVVEAIPPAPAVPVESTPAVSVPVEDPAELVQLLALLMEDATDALAVERAVAGAVRLSALPLATRAALAAPLLKRARKVADDNPYGTFSGFAIRSDLALLTLAWGTGALSPVQEREVSWRPRSPRIITILSSRIGEACSLIADGRAGELLAEPEFADGAISHETLLARLAQWTRRAPCEWDLEQALLRLAPGADEAFWGRFGRRRARQARRVHEESLAPFGSDVVAVGPYMPYVFARRTTPVTAPASRCWELLTDLPATEQEVADRSLRWLGGLADEIVAAWPLLCPNNPELVAAHLLMPLSDGLDAPRSAALAALRGIAAPGRPFGRVGHLAMVTGLASADPANRIGAGEAWARTALDGRLRPDLAALAMAEGVTGLAFRLTRLADGLERAAMDATSGTRVAEAAMATAAALLRKSPKPPKPPSGLHLLLEVAARVSAAVGIPPVPAEITTLAAGKSTTKLAEAARRLTRLTRQARPGMFR